jgi:hypothetical protein
MQKALTGLRVSSAGSARATARAYSGRAPVICVAGGETPQQISRVRRLALLAAAVITAG